VADGLQWDGKVHRAAKFGDPFDWRTVRAIRGLKSLNGGGATPRLGMLMNSTVLNGSLGHGRCGCSRRFVDGLVWAFHTLALLRE
jgi:hypothetical protein